MKTNWRVIFFIFGIYNMWTIQEINRKIFARFLQKRFIIIICNIWSPVIATGYVDNVRGAWGKGIASSAKFFNCPYSGVEFINLIIEQVLISLIKSNNFLYKTTIGPSFIFFFHFHILILVFPIYPHYLWVISWYCLIYNRKVFFGDISGAIWTYSRNGLCNRRWHQYFVKVYIVIIAKLTLPRFLL